MWYTSVVTTNNHSQYLSETVIHTDSNLDTSESGSG